MEFFLLCIKRMSELTEEMLATWDNLDVYAHYARGWDMAEESWQPSHLHDHVGLMPPLRQEYAQGHEPRWK